MGLIRRNTALLLSPCLISPTTAADFARSPLMFYYEVTRACDLVCKHCRASAQENAGPERAFAPQWPRPCIDQVATFPRPPMLVFTGGDPLKRADLFELIRHAGGGGLEPVLDALGHAAGHRRGLRSRPEAGRAAAGHQSRRRRRRDPRCLSRLGRAVSTARCGCWPTPGGSALPVQVNTTITRRNVDQVDAMAELLRDQGIAMWSVFFLVPVGRGVEEERISPRGIRSGFRAALASCPHQPYAVKTTEAPHYRRFVLQQGGDPLAGPDGREDGAARRGHRAPLGVGDGKGVMFVGHTGENLPRRLSAPLLRPLPAGFGGRNVSKPSHIPRAARPGRFKGKCGICEYRQICGGSRARAYALTGDPLESEPDCAYLPGGK